MMMYENYGKCYNVDSSMADVYCDLQNTSDCETKVFTLESNGSNGSFTSNESFASSGSYTKSIPENNSENKGFSLDSNESIGSYTRSIPENTSDCQNAGFTMESKLNGAYTRNVCETNTECQNKVFTIESKGNNGNCPRSISETSDSQNKIFTMEMNGINGSYSRASENPSDCQNKVFVMESKGNGSYSRNTTETFTKSYVNTIADSTCNLRKISEPPPTSRLNSFDSSKYENFSDFEKSDKMLVDVKNEETMTKIFTSEMEEDDENASCKEMLPENNSDEFSMTTSNTTEQNDSMPIKGENHGKIFTVESIVAEPSYGLQKNQSGNWLCDICGLEEPLKDDILTHRILHLSDDHSKQCPICEKKFSSSTSLRNHLTVHTGIKKYRCKYCGRKFGWKTQLAIHENLHTGKGLHHCHVCSKSFMTKWLLQRHVKIHLKDKRRADNLQHSKWNNTTPKTTASQVTTSQMYEKFPEVSTSSTPVTTVPVETTQTSKLPKCNECNQTFKGEDLLAFHLLHHNSAKQNVKHNTKNQTTTNEDTSSSERNFSLENWSTSRCVTDDNNTQHTVDNMDQEKLKFNNLKNPSKGSLTSIVSKLHHKVDEKQKSENDESTEVLILQNSDDNHYLKDSGVCVLKEGLNNEFKLNESLSKETSKQPMSTSSDPFISGMNEIDHGRESAFMSANTATYSTKLKTVEQSSFNRLPHSSTDYTNHKQNEVFQRELRGYFMKQEKELSSLQSMVATLHGKVDSLTNIVTSQSLLINRIFLGGKMVVNGLLDFNVRSSTGE